MRWWLVLVVVAGCRSASVTAIDADAASAHDGAAPDRFVEIDAAAPDADTPDAPPTDAHAPVDAMPTDAPVDAAPLGPVSGDATSRPLCGWGADAYYLDAAGHVRMADWAWPKHQVDVTAAVGLSPGAAELFVLRGEYATEGPLSTSLLIRHPDGTLHRVMRRLDVSSHDIWSVDEIPTMVPVTDSIGVFDPQGGARVIVYRGTDGALHRLVRPVGAPAFIDDVVAGAILPVGPISAGGKDIGLYADAAQHPVAFRIEPDGTITFLTTFASTMVGRGAAHANFALWHDAAGRLFLGNVGTGVVRDMTAFLGLAPVASDLWTQGYDALCGFYRDADSRVIRVCASMYGVGAADMTTLASAPPAASTPMGGTCGGFASFIYFATNGHLIKGTGVYMPPPWDRWSWAAFDVTTDVP